MWWGVEMEVDRACWIRGDIRVDLERDGVGIPGDTRADTAAGWAADLRNSFGDCRTGDLKRGRRGYPGLTTKY